MTEVDISSITENTDPIEVLREAAVLRHRLEGQEEVLVHRARVARTTWTQIAEALGAQSRPYTRSAAADACSAGRRPDDHDLAPR